MLSVPASMLNQLSQEQTQTMPIMTSYLVNVGHWKNKKLVSFLARFITTVK